MLNEKKVVPKLRQEVKVKVDIVTSDDIKIYYTGKFQDFTARCIIKYLCPLYRSIGAMIHHPLSPDGVHPQISSSLRLLVRCLVRLDLFVINYCLFIFFKELISFIGFLDKCHTGVFNVLIRLLKLIYRYTDWTRVNITRKRHNYQILPHTKITTYC